MMYQHGEQGGTLGRLSFFNDKDTNVTHPSLFKSAILANLRVFERDNVYRFTKWEMKKRIYDKRKKTKPLKPHVFT